MLIKLFSTTFLGTFKRFGVSNLVPFQVLTSVHSLATYATLEGFLGAMRKKMGLKMRLSEESLVTI